MFSLHPNKGYIFKMGKLLNIYPRILSFFCSNLFLICHPNNCFSGFDHVFSIMDNLFKIWLFKMFPIRFIIMIFGFTIMTGLSHTLSFCNVLIRISIRNRVSFYTLWAWLRLWWFWFWTFKERSNWTIIISLWPFRGSFRCLTYLIQIFQLILFFLKTIRRFISL